MTDNNRKEWHATAGFIYTFLSGTLIAAVTITLFISDMKKDISLDRQRLDMEISRALKVDERHDRLIDQAISIGRSERRLMMNEIKRSVEKLANKLDSAMLRTRDNNP